MWSWRYAHEHHEPKLRLILVGKISQLAENGAHGARRPIARFGWVRPIDGYINSQKKSPLLTLASTVDITRHQVGDEGSYQFWRSEGIVAGPLSYHAPFGEHELFLAAP